MWSTFLILSILPDILKISDLNFIKKRKLSKSERNFSYPVILEAQKCRAHFGNGKIGGILWSLTQEFY